MLLKISDRLPAQGHRTYIPNGEERNRSGFAGDLSEHLCATAVTLAWLLRFVVASGLVELTGRWTLIALGVWSATVNKAENLSLRVCFDQLGQVPFGNMQRNLWQLICPLDGTGHNPRSFRSPAGIRGVGVVGCHASGR